MTLIYTPKMCILHLTKIRWQNLNKIKSIRHRSTLNSGERSFLKRNLLLTNCITSGACLAFGDYVEQEIERRAAIISKHDWTRIGNMFIVGTLMGPMHHYFYIGLDKLLPTVSFKTSCLKILADQTIAGPISLLAFYYGMGILERNSLKVCTEEIQKKFLTTYAVDCVYWPPIQFINFYYLPIDYRVIYINMATVLYNVFLSYMKHYDKHG